jgi:hypothetical protein
MGAQRGHSLLVHLHPGGRSTHYVVDQETRRNMNNPHSLHSYTRDSPIDESVEIRLFHKNLMHPEERFVLTASVDNRGLIQYNMTRNGVGVRESLSNLQAGGVFPRKAIPGWQIEAIGAAASGLYHIVEIR